MKQFKSAIFLMGVIWFQSSHAFEMVGRDLYTEMDSSQQEELVISLNDYGLELNDYLETTVTVEEESEKVSFFSPAPFNERYKRWVYSGGISYLFPIGPGVIGEVALQNRQGNKILKNQFSVTTTGTFLKGAVQSYQWSPQVQFGRVKLHFGPVFQILHINNPGLEGKQNFFYKAMGVNMGYEFTKKIQDHRWTFDLYMQSTIGGLQRDPTPFLLLGGGLHIMYSGKIKKPAPGLYRIK